MTTQVVLITRGLTGIGRAAAVAFAKKGAEAVASGRHEEVGKALARELRALGAEAEFINADMLTRFTGTDENKAALVSGVPIGRLGLSEELANAIVFIASDETSFITGHVLNVDGGHTAN